jgi:hypothetical protein
MMLVWLEANIFSKICDIGRDLSLGQRRDGFRELNVGGVCSTNVNGGQVSKFQNQCGMYPRGHAQSSPWSSCHAPRIGSDPKTPDRYRFLFSRSTTRKVTRR